MANVLGENVKVANALEAMNEGKAAQDAGDYYVALGYYQTVTNDYPDSIFAPRSILPNVKGIRRARTVYGGVQLPSRNSQAIS